MPDSNEEGGGGVGGTMRDDVIHLHHMEEEYVRVWAGLVCRSETDLKSTHIHSTGQTCGVCLCVCIVCIMLMLDLAQTCNN